MTSPDFSLATVPATLAQWHVLCLDEQHIPQLQAFYAANPVYFEATGGEVAQAGAAEADFYARPPADMPYRQRFLLTLCDEQGNWLAVAEVLQGLLHDDVWHLALFMVDSRWYGQGLAQALYAALEQWMAESGARWLRLGVVCGYQRAERFWLRQGYIEVKQRHGVAMGQRINSLRVMVKPLRAAIAAYLELVARDRPEPSAAG